MEIKGKVHCMFEQEEWRDIKGYEGLYQVSNYGRVKCLSKTIYSGRGLLPKIRKEKIMKTYKDIGGYMYIRLSNNNMSKCFKIHRLVANACISNPNHYPFINHIDEDKTNNCVNTLE